MTPNSTWTLEAIKKILDAIPFFEYSGPTEQGSGLVFEFPKCFFKKTGMSPHEAALFFTPGEEPVYTCSGCQPDVANWGIITAQVERHLQQKAAEALVVWDLCDYEVGEFPDREPLMVLDGDPATPVFLKRSINQIFAWRGTGKTMSALALAGALATGGKFLNMKATRRIKVLYCEGESPDKQLQGRLHVLVGMGKTERGFFRGITLDHQKKGIKSLATAEGQRLLEEALGDCEVLIFDSISTLAWIPTNDEEAWLSFLEWLARLRSRGLCIIFLHHAGKTGLQRGHSRSEDMLDISVKLTRGPEDEDAQHLQCRWEFDKIRAERTGIRNLRISYQDGSWAHIVLEDEKVALLRQYMVNNPGASLRQIAKDLPELGSRETIRKMQNKLLELPKEVETGETKPLF
jgi:hypothetical protein